jgi:hypothetical protein
VYDLFGFMDHKQLQAQTSRRPDEYSSGCGLAKPILDSLGASLGLAISVASVITIKDNWEPDALQFTRANSTKLRRPA